MLETEEASALGSALNVLDDLDERRAFNEIDIIGDLNRDDRGNLDDRDDGAYNNMCDYRGDGNTCGGCGNDSNKPGGPLTRDFSLQL